ncbi:hypothetical protein P3X46_030401 [Hevea brasiliensis]|uniref:Pentatricopeptide repeat-containing protein n=1 Tax=Hevea brasiliensis TaxID=3981 RepID=A0ABQ9KIC2_HEVBR|nr:hypothetical protein P3X46_030401 [Hevea brasiliensis]
MVFAGFITDGFTSSRLIAFCAESESRNLDYSSGILGYLESENPKEAILLYKSILRSGGSRPDNHTYLLLFKVCASLLLNCMDHQIRWHVLLLGFDKDIFVYNAMIYVLFFMGELELSYEAFDEGCVRNLVSWNSLINGYARSGKVRGAIRIYEEMIKEQAKWDEVTMIGLKQYSCMVDLQGMAGLVEEAERLIKRMPIEVDAVVWGALFVAGQIHGNLLMGEKATLKLLELDPSVSGIYVLLANMYREANMKRGVEKIPGSSSIEVNRIVYEFIVADKLHSQSIQSYECLT